MYSHRLTAGTRGTRLAENVPSAPSLGADLPWAEAADLLINPAAHGQFVHELCAAGQAVDHHIYAGRDHLSVVADDSPMIPVPLAWTQARFAGDPAAPAGTTTEH
jgi:hypothetical protein